MIHSSTEFFNNLTDKVCDSCGEPLLEQADCYGCTCSKCDPFQAHHSLSLSNSNAE